MQRFVNDGPETATGEAEGGKVAVIGSGISGLSAAWLLRRSGRQVVLYEAEGRPGGHSNTVVLPPDKGGIAVDTGFIVYNAANYPNLVAMFEYLGVATEASDMSFAASLDGGRLEYSGTGLNGLFGQRSNLVKPRFWSMLRDLLRFYREAPALIGQERALSLTLGDYLSEQRYGEPFVKDHLLPMAAAIWSTTAEEMRAYPVLAFVRFFVSHGLLQLKDRPAWRTVSGGSREYVARILDGFGSDLRLGTPVAEVTRQADGVTVVDDTGNRDRFAAVVIASHGDQALKMLGDADAEERDTLSAFSYTQNRAVLHQDARLMPLRQRVWSSWNYVGETVAETAEGADPKLCVTYWMNRLQNLDPACPLFVTLNPVREPAAESVIEEFSYQHPLFNSAALQAQRELWRLQGRRNTFFCGSYFGYGFHEDGLQAGLAAAEALSGARRPWNVAAQSGRITLSPHLEMAQ
ncbi:FAD-dependent oxidoreductase [Afifella sp. JA880]|uniref:NAD(P)/FAD-dependent oxidoreductase n=1 Tax=Afifella sp. JA880 TaxID=2975280 RepID=UPI0021BAE61D|nr:FAD-dependent oxidoreductase [Afifella sp. JA880]MCT8267686.1 FAD-dependent oxidoreductase [Afifella sp. JA880]